MQLWEEEKLLPAHCEEVVRMRLHLPGTHVYAQLNSLWQ
jgi:hypothetical protein